MAVISILPALAGLALAATAYYLVVIIYRLTFHPLAKYPGPFWARITQWPEAQSAWQGRRHIYLDILHEKYGDVVRASPNLLSFRSSKAWHDIYTDRHANMIKSGYTEATIGMNDVYHTHNVSDRKLHAARRKVLDHAFSTSAMRAMEPQVTQKIRNWCDYLAQPKSANAKIKSGNEKSTWGQERDMALWSGFLTTDVLGQLCFSADFGSCKNGGSIWDDTIPKVMHLGVAIAFLPIRRLLYPFIRSDRLMASIGHDLTDAHINFKSSAGQEVMKRFALEEAEKDESDANRSKDFFYYLVNGNNPETGVAFQPLELVGEALLLLVAGSDTSSTALSATFFYLLHNPRVFDKLAKEVRQSFNDVEEITQSGGKLKDLVYLRACIDEAMRMSPPVPTLLDRVILAGGADIDGTHVPEGINVGVPIYTLQHNEQYHEKPHEYIPERWIEGSAPSETGFRSTVDEQSVAAVRSAFVPFSTGVRGCAGKVLAYMELLTAMARVVYLFDMKEAEGGSMAGTWSQKFDTRRPNVNEYQVQDIFVAKREGPVVEFKKRQAV